MSAGDEYRDWKAGWRLGYAARLAGRPRPTVNNLDPYERGLGDGYRYAADHEAESRDDWALIERNGRTGLGL